MTYYPTFLSIKLMKFHYRWLDFVPYSSSSPLSFFFYCHYREDLANFPPEFTDEPVHLTPDDERIIEKIDQSEFEGFEYVNPLLMSLEDCV